MKKLIIGTLTVGSLVILPGCAHVLEAAGPFIPKIEAGAADKGFEIVIDPTSLGVSSLCLKPDGKPFALLSKIPVVGKVIIEDLFGVCEVKEPAPGDEAPVVQ